MPKERLSAKAAVWKAPLAEFDKHTDLRTRTLKRKLLLRFALAL